MFVPEGFILVVNDLLWELTVHRELLGALYPQNTRPFEPLLLCSSMLRNNVLAATKVTVPLVNVRFYPDDANWRDEGGVGIQIMVLVDVVFWIVVLCAHRPML